MTWEEMIERLHEVFDSEVVNIEEVENILASYKSRSIDWKKYAKFDKYKYTRYGFKLKVGLAKVDLKGSGLKVDPKNRPDI